MWAMDMCVCVCRTCVCVPVALLLPLSPPFSPFFPQPTETVGMCVCVCVCHQAFTFSFSFVVVYRMVREVRAQKTSNKTRDVRRRGTGREVLEGCGHETMLMLFFRLCVLCGGARGWSGVM